jgi:hypothetical protein
MALVAPLAASSLACNGDDGIVPDGGIDGTVPDGTVKPDASPFLTRGEFKDYPADKGGKIEGTIPTQGGEKLLFLLISLDTTPLRAFSYVTAQGSTNSVTLPVRQDPAQDPGKDLQDGHRHRCSFHQQLARILASKPETFWAPKEYYACNAPPKKGDTRTFAVQGKTVTAEAVHVDSAVAYWADTAILPLSASDNAILIELSEGFSKVIVPRQRIYFGQESDLDGDGHISVLFTPLVTDYGAAGYVSLCDLTDPKAVPACAGSNQMELIYSRPIADLPSFGGASAMLELMAHELQHAIYFYRKYLLNDMTQKIENVYITEGLSDLAVDLSGYNGNLILKYKDGLDAIDALSVPNMTSDVIKQYLPDPEDRIMRGGIDLLMRYLFDLAGGDTLDAQGTPQDKGGIKWLRAYVDSADLGMTNITKTTKLSEEEVMKQFHTALALSNRGPNNGPINPDPRYNYLPTEQDPITGYVRGLNLYGIFKIFKMMGPRIQSFTQPDGSLRAGGAEFLQLMVSKAGRLRFVIQTDAKAKAMVRLIRLP